ncbi:MAG: glycosyltransferase [Puniceicoccaceae bacterium]
MRLIVADPIDSGHHLEYLGLILDAFGKAPANEGEILFLVTERAAQELLLRQVPGNVQIEALEKKHLDPEALLSYIGHRMKEPARLFLPRINTFLLPLLCCRVSASVVSGIWFSPQSAGFVHGGGIMERLRGLLELVRIRRMRRNNRLRRLYVLNDPETVSFMKQWTDLQGGVHCLPDPADITALSECDVEAVRQELGIPADAKVFALLGALRSGKGVTEALAAIRNYNPLDGRPCTLLVAGEVLPGFEGDLESALNRFKGAASIQLVTDLTYLKPDRFASYLSIADFLLLPYQNTFGSSGILGHAARTRTPVIASAGGLVGKLTREYELGHTFKSNDVPAFHGALNAALAGSVTMEPLKADEYLRRNSGQGFKEKLLQMEFDR